MGLLSTPLCPMNGINALFKQFKLEKHQKIVTACCAIINSEIEEGHGTFGVEYEIIRENQRRGREVENQE
jgi:hypothetical protein